MKTVNAASGLGVAGTGVGEAGWAASGALAAQPSSATGNRH
jgi:hypothetical protein